MEHIANYKDIYEISKSINGRLSNIKPAAYWIPGKEVAPCALRRRSNGELYIDHLPSTGYSHSNINEEQLNERYFLLKHLPVEYAKAAFWPKEKEIFYVDLMEMYQCRCKIVNWNSMGEYCIFMVRLEGEEEAADRKLRASEYGKRWVFLDPET